MTGQSLEFKSLVRSSSTGDGSWLLEFESGVGYRRRRAGRHGNSRLHAVLRMALGAGVRDEIAQAVMVGHWAGFFQHLLAAILFGVAGLLIVMRPVISAEVMTVFMAMFFLDRRAFSDCRIGGVGAAGMGLAGRRWLHHAGVGVAGARRMAGVGALGDRSLYRDRFDFLRLRLDRTGTWSAYDVKNTNKYPRLSSRCDKRVGECHGGTKSPWCRCSGI